jgi:hypothetical protein
MILKGLILKRIHDLVYLTSILILFSELCISSGCNIVNNAEIQSTSSSPKATVNPTPIPPFEVLVSFPNGAPPLNQSGILQCRIKSNYPPVDMSLEVGLPESLKLVSGNLSWSGNVPANAEVIAIEAKVKSIKTGNYTIAVTGHLPSVNGIENIGHNDIYISISEKSADWRINPAYGIPSLPSPGPFDIPNFSPTPYK